MAGAYPAHMPFSSRDSLGSPVGCRPQRIPLTHTLAPDGILCDPGRVPATGINVGRDTGSEIAMRNSVAYRYSGENASRKNFPSGAIQIGLFS